MASGNRLGRVRPKLYREGSGAALPVGRVEDQPSAEVRAVTQRIVNDGTIRPFAVVHLARANVDGDFYLGRRNVGDVIVRQVQIDEPTQVLLLDERQQIGVNSVGQETRCRLAERGKQPLLDS